MTYDPVDSDVVGFESAADDENGCHSAIILEDDEHGAFPPNTLFRLKRVIEAGFWEAPGGIFPEQRLLIVTATYRAPRAGLSVVSGVGGKMCEPATSLQYGLRSAYIAGLDDILARPALTLEHELSRKITWTDWKGVKYNMKSRSSITCAHPPAPRVRPLAHAMLTTKVRRRISSWRRLTNSSESGVKHYPRQTKGDCCPSRNMEEVLAVRMYSGPAYQPINTFLRSIGQLRGDHRMRLAQDPESTFAATTAELCKAIRKLAAIVSPAEAMQPLARGVRGELPKTFWVPDQQAMICAVDMAFMSTSRNRSTPVAYMGKGSNVLWELQPRAQSDVAFPAALTSRCSVNLLPRTRCSSRLALCLRCSQSPHLRCLRQPKVKESLLLSSKP